MANTALCIRDAACQCCSSEFLHQTEEREKMKIDEIKTSSRVKHSKRKHQTAIYNFFSFKNPKLKSTINFKWLKIVSHSINNNKNNQTHMYVIKCWPFGKEATPLRWLESGCRCGHSRFGRCWLCSACTEVWVPLLMRPRSVLYRLHACRHKQQEVTATFQLQCQNILKSTELEPTIFKVLFKDKQKKNDHVKEF